MFVTAPCLSPLTERPCTSGVTVDLKGSGEDSLGKGAAPHQKHPESIVCDADGKGGIHPLPHTSRTPQGVFENKTKQEFCTDPSVMPGTENLLGTEPPGAAVAPIPLT